MRRDPIRIFVDSDVVISSLLSKNGASYTLLHHTENLEMYVSNFSSIELERVSDRLGIAQTSLKNLIDTRLKCVDIDIAYDQVQAQFANYVTDTHDEHIVAGAQKAKAVFLVTYNLRHFVVDKIKSDFEIITIAPGLFLQYLRSL